MKTVKIAIGQINTTVGDMEGNSNRISCCVRQAASRHVDLIVFPELSITGYPAEDLLLKPHFIKDNIRYLEKISRETGGITAVIGFADRKNGNVYNSAAVVRDKKITYVYHKKHLPNYGVFDEKRYFTPGSGNALLKIKGFSFAVNICEDIWAKDTAAENKIFKKADFLVNISASPYHIDKIGERRKIIGAKAKRLGMPVVYCNLIGGQDELVFDGRSALFGRNGGVIAEARAFQEDLLVLDLAIGKGAEKADRKFSQVSGEEEVYSALVLGLKDYVRKNNFNKVALGLSGGIDSALVAYIAADALGRANVLALSMPSRYSSEGTQEDAKTIADNLDIKLRVIPIDNIFGSYLDTLRPHFKGIEPNIAEENIQARIRGNILMAFSNKFGYLVLNTGNKSEVSAGYCTLYGDMAGGFSVIKDVPKKLVYELTQYRNKKEGRTIIPESVFKRAPTAELRPNQKDQDTLPPYDFLDSVIDLYIEKNKGFEDIAEELGHVEIVKKILNMIDRSEYKRRQAPPGIKITPMAFGKDRRMPITNKFTPR
ncbi:MAG: NAD+ synthase [Candidatus Omnitrophota bacterium]|jgi:NAD+ synthase (glutamine-hydrolysing)